MIAIKIDKSLFDNDLLQLKNLEKVNYWYILLDRNGNPIKEIAFDKNDLIIYKAPKKGNYGLFCDSPITFASIKDYEIIDDINFYRLWEVE